MAPLVSVCCITYNHEKYIADALNSFLMQETSFPIEIIVHDDASTDNTAKIIKEYQEKFPDIIRPIFQIENQYSKRKSPFWDFVAPQVKGKYVATCEGDDYWTDVNKLEKQVDFLEKNQEYTMCFHKVKVVDINKRFSGLYLGLKDTKTKEIRIWEATKGGTIHTSSKLTNSKLYKNPRPEWMKNAIHGDYASALYNAIEGKIFYIDETMSAYRTGVENSMMTNLRKNYTKANDLYYHLKRIETFDMADEFYNYKYHEEIKYANLNSRVIVAFLKNENFFIAIGLYKDFIKQNGAVNFIRLFLSKKTPLVHSALFNIKKRLKNTLNR